ncbi:MAG: ATP-binding protein [Paludibacteraceae bacterium]|nr:ATP-binding protein [Paludibacteraceae bacterium]
MNNSIGLQIDMQQILNVLSASLYKDSVLKVATRELLQNSFDAVKHQAKPRIDVEYDYDRTLKFRDNGIGMSTETVRNVFFTVGGTSKEGLDPSERSGGFGIAKVQFFMAAEKLHVESIRDGIKTIVDTTQEELLSGRGHITTQPTTEPSGTTVELVFPKAYRDTNGSMKEICYCSWHVTDVLEKPLVGYDIPVYYNRNLTASSFPYTKKIVEDYDFGTVEVHFTPTTSEGSSTHYSVHCAGLYQFTKSEYIGDGCAMNIVINVLPKYPAGDVKYPFANSRDDFSGYAKPFITGLKKKFEELARFIHKQKIQEQYSNFGKLSYVTVNGKVHQRELKGECNNPFDWDKFLAGVKDIDSLVKALVEVKKEIDEKAEAIAKEKETNKDASLQLINKMGIEITHSEQEMFSKIASVIYDVIYTPCIRNTFSLSVCTAGVILEKGVGGCCLTLDGISGIYINPHGTFCNANHFANNMTEVLIHELGHTGSCCSGHNNTFFQNESRIRDLFWKNNLYEPIHAKFMSIYLQYNK